MKIDPDGPRLFPATRGGERHYTKLVAAFATPFFRFLDLSLIVIFLLSGERGVMRLFKKTLTGPTARGK